MESVKYSILFDKCDNKVQWCEIISKCFSWFHDWLTSKLNTFRCYFCSVINDGYALLGHCVWNNSSNTFIFCPNSYLLLSFPHVSSSELTAPICIYLFPKLKAFFTHCLLVSSFSLPFLMISFSNFVHIYSPQMCLFIHLLSIICLQVLSESRTHQEDELHRTPIKAKDESKISFFYLWLI